MQLQSKAKSLQTTTNKTLTLIVKEKTFVKVGFQVHISTMVIGETKTQEEKLDEASNRLRETNEASKIMESNAKGAKKKEVQSKGSNKDGMKTRSGGDGTRSDMYEKGVIPASSTLMAKTTIVGLRRQLQSLRLPTSGNKAELEHRLKMYEDLRSTEEVSENDEDDNNNSKIDETMVRVEQETDSESDSDGEETIAGDGASRTRRKNTRERTTYGCRANLFTIKDVEGSISHFSGDDKTQVEQWIEEFEEVSELLKWNELQKVIYAKKLFRGSTKQYIVLQKGINKWSVMKRRMLREFETKLNSALIYSQLIKRKRLPNETPRQYVYAMNTIASQGTIEEEALM